MGYSYMYEEELIMGLLSGLFTGVPSMLLGIATYVLSALAIYTVAKHRGLNNPWLAWVPVVNCWLLGSLSDQYQYVVKGENKSKRKSLLIMNILMMVFTIALVVLFVVMIVSAAGNGYYGAPETEILADIFGPLMAILGLCLPLAGIAIAYAVVRYMALYDVFKSLDPANCVLFLVLSILFSPTEPFFLFFNRHKDEGMPPRKQEQPAYIPRQPVQEPWEADNKDYL